ncbi:MAG: YraN family protein [Bryobacteraceae bacterium]|nr:YraN family protein [Bryobacteraceae bacterium]
MLRRARQGDGIRFRSATRLLKPILVFFDCLRDRARRRSWAPSHALGRRAEDLAHRYLRDHGYTIVARNYRNASGPGEIDLIAWHGQTLVFVEVKSRAAEDYGSPERAMDAEKRTALIRTARRYARQAGVPWEQVRFDLVTVVFTQPLHLTLIPDAFRPRVSLS